MNFSAEDGDFIKSQSTFSQYYAGYGWYGGVTTMTPFSGYLVNVSSNHSFYYPNSLSRIIENIENKSPSSQLIVLYLLMILITGIMNLMVQ